MRSLIDTPSANWPSRPLQKIGNCIGNRFWSFLVYQRNSEGLIPTNPPPHLPGPAQPTYPARACLFLHPSRDVHSRLTALPQCRAQIRPNHHQEMALIELSVVCHLRVSTPNGC